MAELIIGHTTHDSAKVWVRGDGRCEAARVTLVAADGRDRVASDVLTLRSARDWTGVATLRELQPDSDYEVVAHFAADAAGLERGPVARTGRLHTAPALGKASRFDFLLGSCNLSTARLTGLREVAAGYFGTAALTRSVARPVETWYWPRSSSLRRLIRGTAPLLSKGLLRLVEEATRFQLPEPDFPSPFRELSARLQRAASRPAFMIHAGDQIYFDVDYRKRAPVAEEYRRAYRQAWFEDPEARSFLAHCSHYMILDDHEIVDSFENDPKQPGLWERRDAALLAYREYVQARQPDSPVRGALFYSFEYGSACFFVLDTRSERGGDPRRMIDRPQMDAFLDWMSGHRHELKFVVSSVPFVAQLRSAARGESDEERDKWCGEGFRKQRDEIIDLLHREGIERLVFLVGDMHCAYHATLRAGRPAKRVAIHELAGGPIYQLQLAPRRRFHDHFAGETEGGVPFTSVLRSFHGAAPSVTQVSVDPGNPPRVRWEIVRTATQPRSERYEPRPLGGFIRYGELQA